VQLSCGADSNRSVAGKYDNAFVNKESAKIGGDDNRATLTSAQFAFVWSVRTSLADLVNWKKLPFPFGLLARLTTRRFGGMILLSGIP
jgi:hypothetical protein